MQFEIDPVTAIVAFLAILSSIYFYVQTQKLTLAVKEKDDLLNHANFFLSRNEAFEGRL